MMRKFFFQFLVGYVASSPGNLEVFSRKIPPKIRTILSPKKNILKRCQMNPNVLSSIDACPAVRFFFFFRNRGLWSGNSFHQTKIIVNCPFCSSCDILIIKSATFWNSNQPYGYNYWFLNCFPQWWKFQNDAIVKDAEAVLDWTRFGTSF